MAGALGAALAGGASAALSGVNVISSIPLAIEGGILSAKLIAAGMSVGTATTLTISVATPVLIAAGAATVGGVIGVSLFERFFGTSDAKTYNASLSFVAPKEDQSATPPRSAATRYKVSLMIGGTTEYREVTATTIPLVFVIGAGQRSIAVSATITSINEHGDGESVTGSHTYTFDGASGSSVSFPPVENLSALATQGKIDYSFSKASDSNPQDFTVVTSVARELDAGRRSTREMGYRNIEEASLFGLQGNGRSLSRRITERAGNVKSVRNRSQRRSMSAYRRPLLQTAMHQRAAGLRSSTSVGLERKGAVAYYVEGAGTLLGSNPDQRH